MKKQALKVVSLLSLSLQKGGLYGHRSKVWFLKHEFDRALEDLNREIELV